MNDQELAILRRIDNGDQPQVADVDLMLIDKLKRRGYIAKIAENRWALTDLGRTLVEISNLEDLTPHTLGDVIRALREEEGKTTLELADLLVVDVDLIEQIESNSHLPSLEQLVGIADALHHVLYLTFQKPDELKFPCTPAEIELLIALRKKDFRRFMLMASSLLLEIEPS